MYKTKVIEEYILDTDGSTREITFTSSSKVSVLSFIYTLLENASIDTYLDEEGESIVDKVLSGEVSDLFNTSNGYHHGVWKGDDSFLFSQFQTFIDWTEEDSGAYDVEISFFPQDVRKEHFSFTCFNRIVESWVSILGADNFFVRYENASWDLYDSGGLGVIYTRDRPPL